MLDPTQRAERERQLARLSGALDDRPLNPSDSRYFAFHEFDGSPRGLDPIKKLRSAIRLAEINEPGSSTCQVFTGFRGTGKSTELLRLKSELEADGFAALFVEGATYINLFKPLETTDLLFSVAAAVANHVSEVTGKSLARESLLKRLGSFLTGTEVNFDELQVDAYVLKLKAELSRNPSFKERLQSSTRGRLPELVQAFGAFMAEARIALGAVEGTRSPVLIVDDLEKVRGSGPEEDSVQNSVEQIFSQFNWALRIAGWHAIWTTPPYLQLLNPAIPKLFDGCEVLPMVRVWKNDEARTPDPVGLSAVREFLKRRGDLRALLAAPDLLDLLIMASSGHLRDLVRLCKQLVVRVFGSDDPSQPLGETELAEILDDHNQDYLKAVFDSDLEWLRHVAKTRSLDVPDRSMIPRAAKLLDTHVVMAFRNGQQWSDVNAALRSKL